jgi:hypothetical protein
LPTDLVGLADVIVKLKDIVLHESLLAILPFVENPKLEHNKFHAEKKQFMESTGDLAHTE